MRRRNGTTFLLLDMALVFGVLLAGCSPAIDQKQVEEELVAALLDSIVQEIRAESLVDAYLIVWSPVQGSQESPELQMNIDQPVKVWLFAGDLLTEATDPATAIEQYHQDHMTVAIYGLYDLGILSVTEDGQQAEVYVGFDCGIDCHGHANYYFLDRNEMGQWEDSGTGVYIIE